MSIERLKTVIVADKDKVGFRERFKREIEKSKLFKVVCLSRLLLIKTRFKNSLLTFHILTGYCSGCYNSAHLPKLMTDFFNISPRKRKKLAKIFSWFTILSLVLQIGSGVVLVRPAFAGGTLDWEEAGLLPKEGVSEEGVEEGQILGGVSEEVPAEKGIAAQVISALAKVSKVVWVAGLIILAALAYRFYRRST